MDPRLLETGQATGNHGLEHVPRDDVSFESRNAATNALATSQPNAAFENVADAENAARINENISAATPAAPVAGEGQPLSSMSSALIREDGGYDWFPPPVVLTPQQRMRIEQARASGFPGADTGAQVADGQPDIDACSDEPLSTPAGEAGGTGHGVTAPYSSSSSSAHPREAAGSGDNVGTANDGSNNADDYDWNTGHASEVYQPEFDDESNDGSGDDGDRDNPPPAQAGVDENLLPVGHAQPSHRFPLAPQNMQNNANDFGLPGFSGGQVVPNSYAGPNSYAWPNSYTGPNSFDTPSSTYGNSPSWSINPHGPAGLSPLTLQRGINTDFSPLSAPVPSLGSTLQGGQGHPAFHNAYQDQAFDRSGNAAPQAQQLDAVMRAGPSQGRASLTGDNSSGYGNVPGFVQNPAGQQALNNNAIRTQQPTRLPYQSITPAPGVLDDPSRYGSPAHYQHIAQLPPPQASPLISPGPHVGTHSVVSPTVSGQSGAHQHFGRVSELKRFPNQHRRRSRPIPPPKVAPGVPSVQSPRLPHSSTSQHDASPDNLFWIAQNQQSGLDPQPRQSSQSVQIPQPPRNEAPAVHYTQGGAAIASDRLPLGSPTSPIFPANTNFTEHTIPRQGDGQAQKKRGRSDTMAQEDDRVKRLRRTVTETSQQPQVPQQQTQFARQQPQVLQRRLQVPRQLPQVAPHQILRSSSPILPSVPPHLILGSSHASPPSGSPSAHGQTGAQGTPSLRNRQLQPPIASPARPGQIVQGASSLSNRPSRPTTAPTATPGQGAVQGASSLRSGQLQPTTAPPATPEQNAAAQRLASHGRVGPQRPRGGSGSQQ